MIAVKKEYSRELALGCKPGGPRTGNFFDEEQSGLPMRQEAGAERFTNGIPLLEKVLGGGGQMSGKALRVHSSGI
jgi:hypothetical protein